MGRVTGIEPATSSATNWRSNQLSYTRHLRMLSTAMAGIRQDLIAHFV